MVSAAGFEPTAPGFIPLRLAPPLPARAGSVRGLDCPFTLGRKPAVRCCPSSLYTFPVRARAGLGSGLAEGARRARAFPDFEQIRRPVSKDGAQFYQQGILCSILLSYADIDTAPLYPPGPGPATPRRSLHPRARALKPGPRPL